MVSNVNCNAMVRPGMYTIIQLYRGTQLPGGGCMEQIKSKRKSTSDIVYDHLKEAIIALKLEPEQRLIEEELAGQLNVSRTPLREAISKLEAEGLLERNVTGGVKVQSVSIKEVQEIYDIKRALEGMIVEQVAVSWQEDQELAELESLVNNMRTILEWETNNPSETINAWDLARYLQTSTAYHRLLLQLGSNKLCIEILNGLQWRNRRYAHIALNNSKERFLEATREHIEIFEHIKDRNAEKAKASMIRHRDNAAKFTINQLKALETGWSL